MAGQILSVGANHIRHDFLLHPSLFFVIVKTEKISYIN